MTTHTIRRWAPRLLAWLLVAGACALVFGMYTQPDFLRTLAEQLWSCF